MAEMFAQLRIATALPLVDAAQHTIAAVILDALPTLPTRGRRVDLEATAAALRSHLAASFAALLPNEPIGISIEVDTTVRVDGNEVAVGRFTIASGPHAKHWPPRFCFDAPTASANALRVARALAAGKPIMLEGAPGCGKSSLVRALASLAGYELIRVNLSEETVRQNLYLRGNYTPLAGGSRSVRRRCANYAPRRPRFVRMA